MAIRKELIEKLRQARENHDPEEARRFAASLPKARPVAEWEDGESVVLFIPKRKKQPEEDGEGT